MTVTSISSPRVLATGINPAGSGNLSGYVGSALKSPGCDVTVLCRSTDKALRLSKDGYKTAVVDFLDAESMARSIKKLGKFDAVLNTIGQMGSNRFLSGHSAQIKESNRDVPTNIMQAMVMAEQVPLCAGHFGSLMEMPKKAATEKRGELATLTRADLMNPNLSKYGYGKVEGSLGWSDGYHEAYPDLDPLNMHMGMIFGPHDPAAKEMVEGLQKMGVYPRLSYDGDPTVPLIGADEAAAYGVHMLLANLDGTKGGHYFVANPNVAMLRHSDIVEAGEAEYNRKIQTLDFLRLMGVPLPHVILIAGVMRDSALTLFKGETTLLDPSRIRETINQSPYFMINMEANTLRVFEGLREIPVRKSIRDYLRWYAEENAK